MNCFRSNLERGLLQSCKGDMSLHQYSQTLDCSSQIT